MTNITNQIAIVNANARIPSYAFNNPFKYYKPEEEKIVNVPKVTGDKALKNLKAAFKRFEIEDPSGAVAISNLPDDDDYERALSLIQGLKYSSKDITNLSIAIAEFQDIDYFDIKAGLFLSALINNCKENIFTIYTSHLDIALHCIGHENTKHIVIYGNVGDHVGSHISDGSITINGNAGNGVGFLMKGGSIIVNGNAGYDVGFGMWGGSITINGNAEGIVGDGMKGGSIIVNGNAEDYVGNSMEGGSITINGNAGDAVGERMKGGSITIKGNAGNEVGLEMKRGVIRIGGNFSSLAKDIKGGNIFHKGKQIVKDGKRLI